MHIIFDLDGTLLDSIHGVASALNNALADIHHPPHSIAAIRTFIGDGSYALCQRALSGASIKDIDACHRAYHQHYAADWHQGTWEYAGVSEMLDDLKHSGHTLSVLSNKPHHYTVEIVSHFFPTDTFQLVLGQRDEIEKKPHPAGIHEIMQTLNFSPEHTVLVGDSTIDILAAQRAFIHTIAVTWGYHDLDQLTALNPTHVAHSITELRGILATLA